MLRGRRDLRRKGFLSWGLGRAWGPRLEFGWREGQGVPDRRVLGQSPGRFWSLAWEVRGLALTPSLVS